MFYTVSNLLKLIFINYKVVEKYSLKCAILNGSKYNFSFNCFLALKNSLRHVFTATLYFLIKIKLSSYGYESMKDPTKMDSDKITEAERLHDVMFDLLCFIPLVVSVLQILVWRFYKLKNNNDIIAKHVES